MYAAVDVIKAVEEMRKIRKSTKKVSKTFSFPNSSGVIEKCIRQLT
ncbi:Uncharacterized protein APZ42_003620 [Daphnia magna]|uniref:Uncharacterized protein n=1 Tax=Daphnia magna TaxID=35525 RepID=A0A168EM18_9CRUS|nr:Uncharacterized protein APZ42_003620 [Daphnia magna]